MEAIGRVPRHAFVPVEMTLYAYLDSPLPIGCGKTISQPFIVALMTDLLEIGGENRVLEIGTGLAARPLRDLPSRCTAGGHAMTGFQMRSQVSSLT